MTSPAFRILLVEDNDADARMVHELLKDAATAGIGAQRPTLARVARLREAEARLEDSAFDVILLDLSLPDAEGLHAVTRLHALSPDVPIVVMSAQHDEALALAGVQAGAQDYLVKGRVESDGLARAVRYAVARKREAQERTRQAAALWASEQRLATIVMNAPLVLFGIDREGRRTLSIGKGLEPRGARSGAVLGRSVFDAYLDQPEVQSLVRRAMAGETCIGRTDMEGMLLEAWCVPEYDAQGGVIGVIGVTMDVTERAASEHRLRTLVEAAPVGVCIIDEHGVVETVNDAYAELYGYSREEMLGQHIDTVVPGSEQRTLLAQPGATGDSGEQEYDAVTRHGQYLTVLVRTVRIIGSDSRPRRASFAMDISARTQALREAERARAAAEELAHLRSDFVAAVTHELRSPLSAIIGFSELLQANWTKMDDSQRLDRLGKIVRAANREHRLVEDLLLLVRLDARKMQVRGEPVSAAQAARDAADEVCASYSGQRIDLHGVDDLQVLADTDRTCQVLVILLDNAAKYSPEGSPIRVTWQAEGSMLAIRVRDFGPGISDQGRELLFTRFGRAPDSHIRAGRVGTGLGLYLGRQLAHAMGGSLDLEATGSQGSVFCLRLRLVQQT